MMKITVITASYNYADYIRETIESVLGQSYDDFEYIIIDDGSKDNSCEIIEEYAQKDKRIKFLTHPKNANKGLIKTLKYAIQKAQGEYIAFLESDDIWDKDYIKNKIQVLENYSDAGLIFNDVELFGDEERIKNFQGYFKEQRSTFKKGAMYYSDLTHHNIVPTFSCVTVRKTLIEKCNFNCPVSQCVDWFLWVQILKKCPVIFVDKKLTRWRMHKNSYISTLNKNSGYDCFYAIHKILYSDTPGDKVMGKVIRFLNKKRVEKLLRPQVKFLTKHISKYLDDGKVIDFIQY